MPHADISARQLRRHWIGHAMPVQVTGIELCAVKMDEDAGNQNTASMPAEPLAGGAAM